jgi:hypothetical protein
MRSSSRPGLTHLPLVARTVGADGLAGGLGVGEGFVPGGGPQAVQQPPVAFISGKPCGVAFAAQGGDLGQ